MKILLIYPCFIEERIHAEEIAAIPMGLYYIGAMLKSHGHDVEILNWHAAGHTPELVKETLIVHKPDVIGFSILHANRWGAIDIAQTAKALDPKVVIALGGIGATFLWKHLLTHFPQIDYIVLGEGEQTFLNLVCAIEQQAPVQQIIQIPGLALRTPAGPTQTGQAPLITDLDTLPKPARYFDFQHISLSRGCPGRCTFCGSPQFWRRRIRLHSADYFVSQLVLLVERGITFFYVSDDTFTLYPRRVIEVCRKIIDHGLKITWQAISKVNSVNAEMLYWMRKAGCVQISYGVESGSAAIRNLFCKDIADDQIRRAFQLTVAHGILARAYFIYAAPGENDQTIAKTLELIHDIRPLSAIFYILDIFPGTRLYEDYKAHTGITDDIWLKRREDILYFEIDPEMDQQKVLAFGRHLRETFHMGLSDFANRIELKDDPELKAEQADFLSRLGLTFSHGDYAKLNGTGHPLDTAVRLFQRALGLHPDHRAFWGLALAQQCRGQLEKATATLKQGVAYFPDSPELNICLGATLTRLGHHHHALKVLLPFESHSDAKPYIHQCRRYLMK